MLKIIILAFISFILTATILAFKCIANDFDDDTIIDNRFDTIKDFILIFMVLWYMLKQEVEI